MTTGLRELRPEFGPFGITVCRGTLTRLDEAFQGSSGGSGPARPRVTHAAAENRDRHKFVCVSCGFSEHADVNAARNVLRAGLAQGGSRGHLVNAEPVIR